MLSREHLDTKKRSYKHIVFLLARHQSAFGRYEYFHKRIKVVENKYNLTDRLFVKTRQHPAKIERIDCMATGAIKLPLMLWEQRKASRHRAFQYKARVQWLPHNHGNKKQKVFEGS